MRQHTNNNIDYFIFQKWLMFCFAIVLTLMFSGCGLGYTPKIHDPAHGIYSMSQAEFDAEIKLFEQTEGISCQELPDIYDISRLRAGSTVYAIIKVNRGNSEVYETSYSTRILDDIRTTEEGRIYHETIPTTTYLGDILSNYNPDELKKIICTKQRGDASKIIDFKLDGQEEIMIADKPVACNVYKFKKKTVGYDSITNDITTLWVSDEVPFGVVKDVTRRSDVNKTFANSVKTEFLMDYEVLVFDSATSVNPASIIQDIKDNGLGNRYFIKEIPFPKKMPASCAIAVIKDYSTVNISEMGCTYGKTDWNIIYTGDHTKSLWHMEMPDIQGLNYVVLASPGSLEKILRLGLEGGRTFRDLYGREKALFLHPREISLTIPKNKPIFMDDQAVYGKKTGYFSGNLIVDNNPNISNPLSDGIIHKIYGNVEIGQYVFTGEGGDKSNMLTFGIVEPYGYVYLQGKGKVILPNGREVKLGY